MKKIYLYKRCFLVFIIFLLANQFAQAQNTFPSTGRAGIGTTMPNPSSILEMVSTSKGMLVPRMNKIQRDSIVSPATGLIIYQTNSTPGFYYYTGTSWQPVKAKTWNLSGNSGTDPALNFIGTTDAKPLIFKVNNQKAGYIGTSSTTNTSLGYQSLNADTSGVSNTANGFQALYTDASGSYNSAIGVQALFANTSGSFNTASGFWGLVANTLGFYNVATGAYALSNNTTGTGNTANGTSALRNNNGSGNTAIGLDASYSNTTGYSNVAIGTYSLFNNTTGSNLVAVGDSALFSNNGGGSNTAIGSKALYANSTGGYNVALGSSSLFSNTTGAANIAIGNAALYTNVSGSDNIALGLGALAYNSSGSDNIAFGQDALPNNSSGSDNIAFGLEALNNNISGYSNTASGYRSLYFSTEHDNTAFGSGALYSVFSGSYNTAIGSGANVNAIGGPYNNGTALGSYATITASNQVRIGNSSVTSIGGFANWSNISDGRYKKNIKENVPGLTFINALKPVTYNLDIRGVERFLHKEDKQIKDEKVNAKKEDETALKQKEQILYSGFVAQDVEKAAKSLQYDFSGVDAPKNDKDLYGLRYSDFVVPLVKAVQELSAKNEDLEARLQKLETLLSHQATNSAQQTVTNSNTAKLEQNAPDPFNQNTTIKYYIPSNFHVAKLLITDVAGHNLKTYSISATGYGTQMINGNELASGQYQYSLFIDGKLADTKKMVLTK